MLWKSSCRSVASVAAVNTLLHRENRLLIPRLPDVADAIAFDRIPSQGVTHTLVEAALERAFELYKPGRAVLWSGGADSTLALAAMVAQGFTPRIATTDSTFLHADQTFLRWLKDAGCEFISGRTADLRRFVQNGGVFITGTHGDNLVLSDAVGVAGGMNSTLATDVWSMTPPDLMELLSGRAGGDAMWRNYRWLFDFMPADTPRDAANCLWWVGFCFYWHRDSIYMTVYSDYGVPGVTHHHFFNSVPFQRWMLQPVQERAGRSKETHKNQVISAIHQITGFYFPVPQKTDGWEQVLGEGGFENIVCIDDNFKIKTYR